MKKPFDIGSFAYFIRGKNESVFDDRGTPVVIESFVESRRELIVSLLESCVGLSDKTIKTRLGHIDFFIDWLNAHGYRDVFSSAGQAQQACREYTAYLNHLIAHQALKPISARNYQVTIFWFIELLYSDESHHIRAGAVMIKAETGSEAASDAHIEVYRDVCFGIAQQCSAFILNNQPYPLVVAIRDYEVVVFPASIAWIGPFKPAPPAYNTAERRIATTEEYREVSEKLGRMCRNSMVNRLLAQARANLDAANENDRHWHRLRVAGLAAKAYACLFMMITGATPTEFDQFSYADALEVESSPVKKELSAVKFRAGGKKHSTTLGGKRACRCSRST